VKTAIQRKKSEETYVVSVLMVLLVTILSYLLLKIRRFFKDNEKDNIMTLVVYGSFDTRSHIC